MQVIFDSGGARALLVHVPIGNAAVIVVEQPPAGSFAVWPSPSCRSSIFNAAASIDIG